MTQSTYVQEYDAIVNVLNQYNAGGAQADSALMKPAFSDQATIFGVDEGSKLTGGAIQCQGCHHQSRYRGNGCQRTHRHGQYFRLPLH
jgi:hypothetical protein